MNWVEKHFTIEKHLAVDGTRVWHEVRSSLQDACESWREHYSSDGGRDLKDNLENGSRLNIQLPYQVKKPIGLYGFTSILVHFDKDEPSIKWTDEDKTNEIKIEADEQGAFLAGKLSPDELSRRILEPYLFPKDRA